MGDFDLNSKSGLGRGLDSLIPTAAADEEKTGVSEVPIGLVDVNPHQPRTVFDEEALAELSSSIKKHGVLQPLVVTPKDDHYELIAGERRLRASKLAGLSKVPVIIRDADDHVKLELAIIENIHRRDLNAVDEALSYRKLMEEFNYTQEQVAESVGKPRATIANKIRLLTLPADIKRALKEGKLTEGHAKALLSVEDPSKQAALFESILSDGLNVREVEKKAKAPGGFAKSKTTDPEADLMIKNLANDLKSFLGSKVAIKNSNKGGKIEIEYYSAEELARIYQKIKGVD